MNGANDETARELLLIVRDYLKTLKVTGDGDEAAYLRASSQAADVFIDAPFSADVKHCLNDVFNVAIENHITAIKLIKAHKTSRLASLGELALSLFAGVVALFSRKK